ncbi:MAG: methyltransferase regulatory domain-containing protein [Dehalococcoidia bacterium]
MAKPRKPLPNAPAAESAAPDIQRNYDEIPYPTHPNDSAQPDRMAVVATLRGLKPAPVGRCRVLEVGCGDGSNLLSIAAMHPGSECVGLDLSGEAIARGLALAAEAGIANVRLIAADLRQVDESWGSFDYIIAHGLYSWVPPDVRRALLQLIRGRLSEQGVALVSYNAMPGGHFRRGLREMMFFHLRETEAPQERVDEAKALMQLVTAAELPGLNGFQAMLAEQAQLIAERTDADLFHDELSPINESFYFTEFLRRTGEYGLQYVGEAEWFTTNVERAGPLVAQALAPLAEADPILKEQYLDFVTCRMFRKTLLCRSEAELHWNPEARDIAGFWASSDAVAEAPDADGRQRFASAAAGTLTTADVRARAVMAGLQAAQPGAVAFSALVDAAMAASAEESRFKCATHVANFLVSAYGAGVIELFTQPPHLVRAPGERPIASPLARAQTSRGDDLTTLRHTEVAVSDAVGKALIGLLDGTRDRAELLAALQAGPAPEETAEHLESKLRELGLLGLLLG